MFMATVLSRLESCNVLCACLLVYVSSSQDRFVDVGTWLFGTLQPVDKDLV